MEENKITVLEEMGEEAKLNKITRTSTPNPAPPPSLVSHHQRTLPLHKSGKVVSVCRCVLCVRTTLHKHLLPLASLRSKHHHGALGGCKQSGAFPLVGALVGVSVCDLPVQWGSNRHFIMGRVTQSELQGVSLTAGGCLLHPTRHGAVVLADKKLECTLSERLKRSPQAVDLEYPSSAIGVKIGVNNTFVPYPTNLHM